MGNNIVDFNKYKENKVDDGKTISNEEVETMWQQLLDDYNISEEVANDITNAEGITKYIEEVKKEHNGELVFGEQTSASVMANFLLTHGDEYSDVSYFEIVRCTSRLSTFYKLVPVMKSDKSVIMTPHYILLSLDRYNFEKSILQYSDESDNE